MRNFIAKAAIIIPALTLSSFAHAQTQPSETKEHKELPPICRGEANRFNCASATVEGQTDEPGVDSWGRPIAAPAKGQKSAPAPRHDISGTWQVDGVDEFGFRGVLGLIGAPSMPSDGYPEHEPPYTKAIEKRWLGPVSKTLQTYPGHDEKPIRSEHNFRGFRPSGSKL